jgi:hypothetical protein
VVHDGRNRDEGLGELACPNLFLVPKFPHGKLILYSVVLWLVWCVAMGCEGGVEAGGGKLRHGRLLVWCDD